MRYSPMRRRALRYRYPAPPVRYDYTSSGKLVLDLSEVLHRLDLREMLQENGLRAKL